MTNKLLIAGGLIMAFVAGVVFEGHTPFSFSRASTDDLTATQRVASYPARRVVRVAQPVSYVDESPVYQEQPRVQKRRSWERSVLIVAGSSGAGAAIGAVAGGGKGAKIGAVSGAVGGLIYDVATRDR